MTDPLFATMDIGSGPRDPGLVGLLADKEISEEQSRRVSAFVRGVDPSLAARYASLVKEGHPEAEESVLFLTELAVRTLEKLGYNWVFDLEWPRTEMVDWESADVGGLTRSEEWQRSYGYRFWKPSGISAQITYKNSDRHVDELKRVARFAKKEIRFPITDPHCEVRANDNLYYYGRELSSGRSEVLASLAADHEATLEFARSVTLNRVRALSENAPPGKTIAVQYDNFIVAGEEKEFDRPLLAKQGLSAPSYIEALKEITPSLPNVRYFIHNCLQDYSLYVPYLLEVPRLEKFCLEMSSHDTERLGTTDEERRGPGFESLKQFKEYGLRKGQVVGVGVASTYEGAVQPAPELVRDRILYAVKVLEDPWKVQPVLDCGLRNLSLSTMWEIGLSVHRGRDMALQVVGKEQGIDVTPYLTGGS